MTIAIIPATPDHVERFHATLDAVAREGLWLGMTEAKPVEELRAFVLDSIERRNPIIFAMKDGELLGWCDITRSQRLTRAHTGVLGMGVLKEHRGHGIGSRLMQMALDKAASENIPRIELTVYVTNVPAIALYRKFGFIEEGELQSFAVIKGSYVNGLQMARVDAEALQRFLSNTAVR